MHSGGPFVKPLDYNRHNVTGNYTWLLAGDRRFGANGVKPPVQTVDFGNSTSRGGQFVPAIVTRQINRAIDLKPGQSFAITGLLNDQVVQQLKCVPDLQNKHPMKSILNARIRRPTGNLVVLVTPQIVAPPPAAD